MFEAWPIAPRQPMKKLIKRFCQRLACPTVSVSCSPVQRAPGGYFVFIHINKTGGTSMGSALGLPVKQHLTAREVIRIIGAASWQRAYRFSIVRNPWDKVVSHYKYRVMTNQNAMSDVPIPFADWVAATYGPDKRLPYYDNPVMFQPQVDWLSDLEGKVDMNLIGRFEDLPAAYRQIAKRLGLRTTLPHLNRTEPSDYRSFYDDRTAETVSDWFRKDIGAFGYRFDG